MHEINWEQFSAVELRVGTVLRCELFEKARKPAYVLHIDFGEFGVKKSSAQITDLYQAQDLIGRQVMAVTNFPPKQIGPMKSECLVTGFYRSDGAVVLAVPDQTVEKGSRLA
jgi:tRNA-binding protein